jgi:2'-hydroxyisoflavone reductase
MPASRRRFLLGCAAAPVAGWTAGCRRSDAPPSVTPATTPAPTAAPPVAAASKAPRLLVLGGTGFLGPHVVEAALAKSWEVTLFNRGKTRPELFPDVEKLQGDRDGKLDALRGRSWDAVIDTSGYVPRIVGDSAKLLADAVEHYVFVSSISAYADFSKVGIVETDPVATMPDPTIERVMEFYGALKALCEQTAEATMPGRVTNVRPGFIVGPDDPTDRFTYWPVRVARGGEMLAPGVATDPVQFIDVRDLSAWIIGAVEHKHMGVYNLCGPREPMPMGELLQACLEVTGSDAKLTWVDTPFLEANKVVFGADLPIWVPSVGESAGFGQVSNAKALATGLACRDAKTVVADTLAYWNSLPETRRKTLRAGWLPQREAEVLAAFHARDAKPSKGKGKKTKAPRRAETAAAAG